MIDLKTARDSLAVFFCARKTGPQNGPEESGKMHVIQFHLFDRNDLPVKGGPSQGLSRTVLTFSSQDH